MYLIEIGAQQQQQQHKWNVGDLYINNWWTVNTIAPKLLFAYMPISWLFIAELSAPRLPVHPFRKCRPVHKRESLTKKRRRRNAY